MITLGIDLAAEPRDAGGCAIEWTGGVATIRWVSTGLQDEEILRCANAADVVGIDAPFGWPTYFVEAISAHHAGRKWPVEAWEKPLRRRLRLRVTDCRVHQVTEKLTPLSVSSDAIAIPATRCAWLLDRLEVSDRSGGRVQEVYPAAALFQWGLRYKAYKGPEGARSLEELLGSLKARIPWLTISATDERLCATSDDAFDALVASLVARAAYRGLTLMPTAEEQAAASVEGWIALPLPGSLEQLPLPAP